MGRATGRKSSDLNDVNKAKEPGKFPTFSPKGSTSKEQTEESEEATSETEVEVEKKETGKKAAGKSKAKSPERLSKSSGMVEVGATVPPWVKDALSELMEQDPDIASFGDAACHLFGRHHKELEKQAESISGGDPDNPFASTGQSKKRLPRTGGPRAPLSLWLERSQQAAIKSLMATTNKSLPLLLQDAATLEQNSHQRVF